MPNVLLTRPLSLSPSTNVPDKCFLKVIFLNFLIIKSNYVNYVIIIMNQVIVELPKQIPFSYKTQICPGAKARSFSKNSIFNLSASIHDTDKLNIEFLEKER